MRYFSPGEKNKDAAMFPVPKVQDNYDEQGNAIAKPGVDKRAKAF